MAKKTSLSGKPKAGSRKPAAGGAAAKSGKFVYLFGRKTDGNGTMKPLLGC